MNFNSVEKFSFSNISATTAAFILRGGSYGITVHATFGGGNVVLQRQAADGVTFVNVITALTVDGYAATNLPGGIYRFGVTTATAVYADVTSVVTAL